MGSYVSQTVSLKVLNSLPYRGTGSLSWFSPCSSRPLHMQLLPLAVVFSSSCPRRFQDQALKQALVTGCCGPCLKSQLLVNPWRGISSLRPA